MRKISDVTLYERMSRRRSQKDGYLFERSGMWLGQYRVDSPDEIDEITGKAKRERITVALAHAKGPDAIGKREARKIFRDEYLAPVNAANMRPSSGKPLAEFIHSKFYPDYLPTLKFTGQTFYRSILGKHVLPILGPLKLREISVERVQSLLTLKGKSLSTQTVRHIRNCLSAVLKHAKSMGWFYGELPTTGVRLPEMKRETRQAPTWDQTCQLASALPEPCSTLVLFLTLTGLRIGEAMGLRWSHVNLTANPVPMGLEILPPFSLAVRENYVMGKYSTLKTQSSVRNVPIPEWFVQRLAVLQKTGGATSSESPVFANISGLAPIDQHNLARRVMKPAATKLGMEWVSWHCFRHTYATLLKQAGMSMRDAQLLLGHAAATMTAHYTHGDMEQSRAMVELMANPKQLDQKPSDFAKQLPPESLITSTTVH